VNEYDVYISNNWNIELTQSSVWNQGFIGRMLAVTHACARCETNAPDNCDKRDIKARSEVMDFGWPSVNFCDLTLPRVTPGYSARWAPGADGIPMNRGDPHMCSPGPENESVNIIMHMLASLFRKPLSKHQK
jgi:hypothetical protein